jgi:ribosomal protein S18 acetylase RimI-like enzyme
VTSFERALAFQRRIGELTSTRVQAFAWGTVFRNDDYPERWDSNYLLVERPIGGVEPSALAREADRLLGGLGHREIVVNDEADGDRVAMGLGELGYEGDRLLVMERARDADREPPELDVEEVDLPTIHPLLVAVNRRGHGGMSPEVARMLADFKGVLVRQVGARFFAVRVHGELAGCCELYVRDGVGQIEDVNTLAEFRGRGIARAVVSRATQEGLAAGCEPVFLVADDADWPKELYTRLGFDVVGRFRSFVKPPPGASYR